MPEKHLRFKVAVAAAIHQRFLQLAADHAAHHVGIGFPAGLQLADLQAEQAVNAAQIGFLPHQFHRGLRRLLLAVQEQRFIVNHINQVELRKGFHIAGEHIEPFLRQALCIISVIKALAHHAQIGMVLLFNRRISFNGGRIMPFFLFDVAQNHIGAGAFFIGIERFLHGGAGGGKIRFKQSRLRQLAIKLGDFELIGLLVVAEPLRGGDGFFPVAVLLIDIEQHLARFFAHIAAFQTEKNLLGSVHKAGALVILPQFKQHALALFAHGVGRIEQRLVHGDGFVVFSALAVELAQGEVEVIRLRLLVDHFGQFACGFAAIAIHQRIEAFIKAHRHAFGLLEHGFHVYPRGKPAHGEKHRQQDNRQQPHPDFVFHARLFLGGRRHGHIMAAQAGGFFHFGAQAGVFIAQREQAAEKRQQAKHCAHQKSTKQHQNQRQAHFLAGQIKKLYRLRVAHCQQ